jgi:hypothetical protein
MKLVRGLCIQIGGSEDNGTVYENGELKKRIGELYITHCADDGLVDNSKWFLWFSDQNGDHFIDEVPIPERRDAPLEQSMRAIAPKHNLEVVRVFVTLLLLQ